MCAIKLRSAIAQTTAVLTLCLLGFQSYIAGPTDLLERRRGAGTALVPMPPLRAVALTDKGSVVRRLILTDTGGGNAGDWRVVPGPNAAVAKLGAQSRDMLSLATRAVALLEARQQQRRRRR